MAFASVGTFGTATSRNSQSLQITAGSTAVAGDLIVIAASKSNTSTAADGETNEVASVTDPSGTNQWVKAGEFCNSNASVNAGAVVAIWYSMLSANIASGAHVTVNFDAGFKKESAVSAWRFTTAGTKVITVVKPVTTQATDAGAAPSKAISGLTSKEYLFFRAEAAEQEVVGTFTVSGGFTKITAAADGATTSAGASINGEFVISTATSATSAPTGTTATVDRATLFVALHEVDGFGAAAMSWTF